MSAELRDRTAVAGVGWTEISKKSGQTELALATRAALSAIVDAGLEPSDIDGLITFHWGPRDTPAPSEMVASLGLNHCTLSLADGGGGAWAGTSIAMAAAAVATGICRHVLVYRGANNRSVPTILPGTDIWPSGQRQWSEPFGDMHAATLYGPAVSAYMAAHGIGNSDFAPLAVQSRAHAGLNTKALMREPMTIDEHQASPWVIHPFRMLDCSIWNDGAMAVVVSSAEDSRANGGASVLIRSALGGGVGTPVRARTATADWELNAASLAPRLFERAGITAAQIDVAELYDPFTGVTMLHVEQFGLAEAGTAPARIADGEFGLDGRVPLNTNGGHMSEGNLNGLGHVIEAVQQLREGGVSDDLCVGDHDHGREHCRQVRDPEFALVCGECGDSGVILRKDS